MKKLIYGLSALLLITAACKDDDVEPEREGGAYIKVDFSETELNAPASGKELTFVVTSEKEWNMTGAKSWCTVSPSSGIAGETVVTVKVAAEPLLTSDRNAVLNISGNPLLVTQKKADALLETPDKYCIPVAGGNIHMTLVSETSSVTVPKEYESWITKVNTTDKKKVNFSILPAKQKSEVRQGYILVKAKGSEQTDTVSVFQAPTDRVVLENKNKVVPNHLAAFTIEVNSPAMYEVSIPEAASWLKMQSEAERLREDRITFMPEEITDDDNRGTLIIIKNKYSLAADTVNLCQTADGSLLLMKSHFEAKVKGDTINIRIKETAYTAEILGGITWLEKVSFPPTRSLDFPQDSMRFAVGWNVTPNERTARIVFTETATGITDTLKIHQAGAGKIEPAANGERAMIASYNTIFTSSDVEKIERKGVLVSWRWLTSDPDDIAFDIYRSENGGEFVKLNANPIETSSNYKDLTADVTKTNEYQVKQFGTEKILCSYTFTPEMAKTFYRSIKLNMNNLPDPSLQYKAGDAAVGDIDGDGEYEIVLKRDVTPTDNVGGILQEGTSLLEAYKLDGTFLWRVNLGINVRQGNHYTPFIVYDLDGDGRAEVVAKTSEGTIFGDGTQIGDTDGDGRTVYLNSIPGTSGYGMVLEGPEFLSILDGGTGTELARTDYIPRGEPAIWDNYWGDNWGNRIDRFLLGVGHLDTQEGLPSIFMCRGYYHNFQIVALDFRGGELRRRWHFNTSPKYLSYRGQGNHNIAVGDVDNDGKDELIYGACAIDHDGTGLYSTGLGHGDALHLGDFDPSRPGLEVVACHEEYKNYRDAATEFRDAATGRIIWSLPGGTDIDVGRCMVADIDPNTPGCEVWSSYPYGNLYSCKGELLPIHPPTGKAGAYSYNMGIWWSGSLNRQALDWTMVMSLQDGRIFQGSNADNKTYYSVKTINSTKSNPCFYGDILGDWREEMIYVNDDDTELRIFTTDFETEYRFHPLMDDHIYRLSATHQNIGYNQPTHTGFYLGSDLLKK